MLELLKPKNAGKNCPARRNRKRKDNGDFIKEILLLQPPRRPSEERQSQPILNRHRFSGEKASYSPLPRILRSPFLQQRRMWFHQEGAKLIQSVESDSCERTRHAILLRRIRLECRELPADPRKRLGIQRKQANEADAERRALPIKASSKTTQKRSVRKYG